MLILLWIIASCIVSLGALVISDKTKSPIRSIFWQTVAGLGLASLVVAMLCGAILEAVARDRGQFAQSDPATKAWFNGLRSGKGPCCSDADGYSIADADWEAKDGHYRVRVPSRPPESGPSDMVWVDVDEYAVITEPNRVGHTMVWPIYGYMGVSIRCFMPGSMT